LITVLVFVPRDFELGRKLRCDIPVWLAGVDRQSRKGLIFIIIIMMISD